MTNESKFQHTRELVKAAANSLPVKRPSDEGADA